MMINHDKPSAEFACIPVYRGYQFLDKRHGFSPLLGPFRNALLTAFRGDIKLIKSGRIAKLISICSIWFNYPLVI